MTEFDPKRTDLLSESGPPTLRITCRRSAEGTEGNPSDDFFKAQL
jgi:hypothetical protein